MTSRVVRAFGSDPVKYGAEVEFVTPERMLAPEIGGLNHAAYARIFHRAGVRVTMNSRLLSVRRAGNELLATLD